MLRVTLLYTNCYRIIHALNRFQLDIFDMSDINMIDSHTISDHILYNALEWLDPISTIPCLQNIKALTLSNALFVKHSETDMKVNLMFLDVCDVKHFLQTTTTLDELHLDGISGCQYQKIIIRWNSKESQYSLVEIGIDSTRLR